VEIPDRQGALDALAREYLERSERRGAALSANGNAPMFSDDEVVERLKKESTDKGARLLEGDTSEYPSHSEADIALCQKIAFYSQDPEQIERIWRRSGLWRDKGDSHRSYASQTIEKALERTEETYTETRIKAVGSRVSRSRSPSRMGQWDTHSDDRERSITAVSFRGASTPAPREWLVEDLIPKNHAASWYGAGGSAKSMLAMHLGLSVADPKVTEWFGYEIQTVPVIYLDFELDKDEQHRRVLELCAGAGMEPPENFYYLNASELPTAEAFELARAECERLGVEFLMVDSVGFALDGDAEVSKDVLAFFKQYINPLKSGGVTPLLIDHQAKIIKGEKYGDKEAFGSVYKTNNVRSAFQLRGESSEGEIAVTFTHKKNNFGRMVDKFTLVLTFGAVSEGGRINFKQRVTVYREDHARPDPDREPTVKERVQKAWAELGEATAAQVAEYSEIPLKSVKNAATELKSEGALEDTGRKVERAAVLKEVSRRPDLPRDRDRDTQDPRPDDEPVSEGEEHSENGQNLPLYGHSEPQIAGLANEAFAALEKLFDGKAHPDAWEAAAVGQYGMTPREFKVGKKRLEDTARVEYHMAERYADSYYYTNGAPK
jgi:hypothetical protein